MILFSIGAAYLAARILLPLFLEFLRDTGNLRQNYQGILIANSLGLVFLPVCLTAWEITALIQGNFMAVQPVAAGAILVILAGLIDDVWGTGENKGLRRHLAQLFRGRLTTGTIKAFMGIAAGMILGLFFPKNYWITVTLLVALSMNTLNLFDLRPGRAGKVFLIISLLFLLGRFPGMLIIAPVLGTLLAYLPFDLKGKAMLGDTGSNFLGFAAGAGAAVSLNFAWQVAVILILVMLHWFSERYSISELVENRPLLKRLDQLGRK